MNIVLLGGPGSGKGTQAQMLVEKLGIPHVASGDLFREHLKAETNLGREAQAYIRRGDLVPAQVTIAMIRERLSRPDCAHGVILDGFPRTMAQAEALNAILKEQNKTLDLVLYIQVSEDTLLKRLEGRWTCPRCGAVYHMQHNPPRVAGQCDACKGELYQREDDRPEVQKRRVDVYFAQTAPLICYYDRLGVLTRIDGEQDVATVQSQILAAIRAANERVQERDSMESGGR